jgi:hypothetical protein
MENDSLVERDPTYATLSHCLALLSASNEAIPVENLSAESIFERLRLTQNIGQHLQALCPASGYFAGLPTEIIEHILFFLDHDFTPLSGTCKSLWHVCETRAHQLFQVRFGTNKPANASWCCCFRVVAHHFTTESIEQALNPGTVLFYGLSEPRLLSGLHIDWSESWCVSDVYKKLVRLHLWDTLNNLFIPYCILEITKRKTRGRPASLLIKLLCAIMKARDRRSFDALMALETTNRPLPDGFVDHVMLLSKYSNNEFLPDILTYFGSTPEKIRCVVHIISARCSTMQDAQLLNVALTTFGASFQIQIISEFWSQRMFYFDQSSDEEDVVDTYINTWLRHHPHLLSMEWGGMRHLGRTLLNSFCNILVRGSCRGHLIFFERHPDLRFDDMSAEAANKWWDLCAFILERSWEMGEQCFDILHARGLPLTCTPNYCFARKLVQRQLIAFTGLLRYIQCHIPPHCACVPNK